MTRVLAFSLLGFLLVTLLGPVQNILQMDLVVVDVPLVIVMYLAMADRGGGFDPVLPRMSFSGRSQSWSGGATALILGYLTDLLGGGPKGLHAFILAVVFLICRRAARHVYLAGLVSSIIVTFTISLVSSMLGLLLRWIMALPPTLDSLSVAGTQALVCAAVAPLLIRLLSFLDVRIARTTAAGGTLFR